MKFQISKDELLAPLQQVIGVVERKQTHEVLNNFLVRAEPESLSVTATDNEVEHQIQIPLIVTEPGVCTLPARKLVDICRSLPATAQLDFQIAEEKARIVAGRSRFTLATLPHEEFPIIAPLSDAATVELSQQQLARAIKMSSFAMAQQDVRYYLNGLLLELSAESLCCVATDGHRLALHRTPVEINIDETSSAIIPRKAIAELSRLLQDVDSPLQIKMTPQHLQFNFGSLQMTCKLIDGKFPNYDRVIPITGNDIAKVDRELFRQALARSSIMANETYKGVRVILANQSVELKTNNPNHEEAEDELEIEYQGQNIDVGFNVNYLIDVLNVVETDSVELHFKDDASSMVIHPEGSKDSVYVVMPMRL